MPIPNEYLPLINQLADKTKEGKVRWKQTRFGGFSVAVGGTDFRIWAGEDEDTGQGFVNFSLNDPTQSVNRSTVDNWSVDQGDQYYDLMYELFAAARRHALGIPKRLSALEEALKSSDMIGDEPNKKSKFDDE